VPGVPGPPMYTGWLLPGLVSGWSWYVKPSPVNTSGVAWSGRSMSHLICCWEPTATTRQNLPVCTRGKGSKVTCQVLCCCCHADWCRESCLVSRGCAVSLMQQCCFKQRLPLHMPLTCTDLNVMARPLGMDSPMESDKSTATNCERVSLLGVGVGGQYIYPSTLSMRQVPPSPIWYRAWFVMAGTDCDKNTAAPLDVWVLLLTAFDETEAEGITTGCPSPRASNKLPA
jgi:hypothetical protein